MKQAVCLALGADVKTELDRLAQRQDRSRSWLANHAIRQFLDRNRGEAPSFDAIGEDAPSTPSSQPNPPQPAAV
jgi:predicted transcriptional regulator